MLKVGVTKNYDRFPSLSGRILSLVLIVHERADNAPKKLIS